MRHLTIDDEECVEEIPMGSEGSALLKDAEGLHTMTLS